MLESLKYIVENGYLWLTVSLFVAMSVTQFLKQLVKAHAGFLPLAFRKPLVFVIAFGVGYACALYFLKDTGIQYAEKWSVAVALLNPAIYLALVEYAVRTQKWWLLALLKQRSLQKDANGVPNHNETQTFFRGDHHE